MTAQQKRVSVVIANYNMARFLASAVESVLAQTQLPYEVHVVDDGSTDDSREVLKRFEGHPLVRCHYRPNAGQASAKNCGILASEGEFIAFLDADDLWTADKLETQLAAFEQHPSVGIVYTNFAHIDEKGQYLSSPDREYYSGWISGRLLVDNFVNGMASIVRRECFETVGVFDETLPMGIDYDLWLRLSAKYEFLYLDRVTYLYRRWSGQMSHRWETRMECAIKIMNRFIASHPGLVDQHTVREAWAHTYVTRGSCSVRFGNNRSRAFGDYLRALRQSPAYLPAWKGIAKLIVD